MCASNSLSQGKPLIIFRLVPPRDLGPVALMEDDLTVAVGLRLEVRGIMPIGNSRRVIEAAQMIDDIS